MESKVSEFKKKNQEKCKEEYLKGCYNSEIDDTETEKCVGD